MKPVNFVFFVEGSDGFLICFGETGKVIAVELHPGNGDSFYKNISKIDLRTLDPKPVQGSTYDILNVGYWNTNGTYEPKIKEAV